MTYYDPPDFQTPFYGGLGVATDVGGGGSFPPGLYPVALGGRSFLIDVTKYKRAFIDAYRQAQDTTNQPGEQTLTTEGVWTRYGTDWRYGAGQSRFDRSSSDRRRFRASLGVDPWTEGRLSLLNKTQLLRSENKTHIALLVAKDGRLISVKSDGIDIISGVYTAPTVTAVTGLPGATAITGATLDDSTCWVATAAGVYSFPINTAVATRWDNDAPAKAWDSILLANGRIVGGVGNELRELGASGAVTTARYTHPSPAFRWTVLFGHPRYIYGGGTIGSVSELFRFGVNESTGALNPGVASLNLPGGEQLNVGLYYVGKVFLGTSRGVRMAEVSDGDLAYGALIDDPDDVRCLYGYGDYVWFGWTAIATSKTGVGRLAPTRFGFAEGGAPAYATDVYYAGSGTVKACALYAGRIVFAIDGLGLAVRNDQYVDSGWVTTGIMDFGIPYTTQPLDVTLQHDPLLGTIAVEYQVPGSSWTNLGVSNNEGTRQSASMLFSPLQAESIEFRLTLTAKTAAEAPVLTQWLLRTSPQPKRVEQLLLPLVFSNQLRPEDQHGPTYEFDPLASWKFLSSLCNAGAVVLYQEGKTTYKVKVKDVQVDTPWSWSEEGDFFNCTVPVILQVVS